jgi:hypothetical protein
MLYWLAQAAKQAREAAERKQVHVAASADRDQSSIYRFEQARTWPRDPDAIIGAYADDLDVDPVEIWATAVELWRAWAAALSPEERAAQAAEAAAARSRKRRPAPSRGKAGRPRRGRAA